MATVLQQSMVVLAEVHLLEHGHPVGLVFPRVLLGIPTSIILLLAFALNQGARRSVLYHTILW